MSYFLVCFRIFHIVSMLQWIPMPLVSIWCGTGYFISVFFLFFFFRIFFIMITIRIFCWCNIPYPTSTPIKRHDRHRVSDHIPQVFVCRYSISSGYMEKKSKKWKKLCAFRSLAQLWGSLKSTMQWKIICWDKKQMYIPFYSLERVIVHFSCGLCVLKSLLKSLSRNIPKLAQEQKKFFRDNLPAVKIKGLIRISTGNGAFLV